MPTIPKSIELTKSSADILNAIRNSASANYQGYVPIADPNTDSIKEIGRIIMTFPALQNEFLSALVNRIGRVIISSKLYDNPWAVFKKGILEFGETIEEIFVNIAKPFQFDPAVAETKVFAREIPDVRAAFHILNYQKFYKVTIQNEQLRQAFLSWDGISDLIAKIVDSLYTSANYDEFQTMKYLLARHILDGNLYPVQVSVTSPETMKNTVSTIKGISNDFTFMSTDYNVAGVATHTNKDEQYIILNSGFDATMDVEVLASAFNMSKADFMGHRVLVDSFGKLDNDRLNQLFGGSDSYTPITEAELTALNAIPAVLVSREWFVIVDNMQKFTEQYNGEGLYWNYWYHTWKTFSISPFANSAVFVPGVPSVRGITISPATATVTKGQSILLSADVQTEYFANKAVKWTAEPSTGVTIDIYGNVSISPEFTGSEVTITATSVFDDSKTATATITVQ